MQQSPLPSPFRLRREDLLLRRPLLSPLGGCFSGAVLSLRQPPSTSPLAAWELLGWLAGGPSPLFFSIPGRWLEFHRTLGSGVGSLLLLRLLGSWVPRLIRRDLAPRLRFDGGDLFIVLRSWGELGLPLARDFFGLRLPLRIRLVGVDQNLLSFFRLVP